jgi:DNA repair protein RecO (recombination protein O)
MEGKVYAFMLRKTAYSDQSSVVEFFSRAYGKIAFIHYHKKGKSKKGMYLPLMGELEIDFKPGKKRGLPILSEYIIREPLINCSLQVEKTAVLFFISELLQRSIQEDQPETELYDFTRECLKNLESEGCVVSSIPLLFISRLCVLLGFSPSYETEVPENAYFSIREGCFVARPALYEPSFFLEPADARQFYAAHYQGEFPKSQKDRQKLLSQTLKFLQFHLPELSGIKSHEVLKSVFQSN